MGLGRRVCILTPQGLFRFILEYDICNYGFPGANNFSSLPWFGNMTALKVKMGFLAIAIKRNWIPAFLNLCNKNIDL